MNSFSSEFNILSHKEVFWLQKYKYLLNYQNIFYYFVCFYHQKAVNFKYTTPTGSPATQRNTTKGRDISRGLMSRPLAKIRDRLRGREIDIPPSLLILQGRWKRQHPHLCRFYKDGGNGNILISADPTRMVETATYSSPPILQGRWKSTSPPSLPIL